MDIDNLIKNAKENIEKESKINSNNANEPYVESLKENEKIESEGLENKQQDSIKSKELMVNKSETTLSTNDLQSLQQEFLKKQIDSGKTLNEITNDFAHAVTTNEIFSNDTKENLAFKKELKQEKKESIKETFVQEKVSNQTKTIGEKQRKAEAFYKSFRPILEFDFSNLIKVNKEDKSIKEYSDRSYGIVLMCLMLFLYTPLYCVVSLVLALFNSVNAIFAAISNFGKIAKSICYTIFIIIILVLAVYLSLLGIEKLFNINIIPNIVL